MQIDKINPTAFQAKFIHTDDLKNVVEYAVKHNKFDKLIEARKNMKAGDIDKITVVIWIEGDDPECTNALIGGHLRLKMSMREEFIQGK